MLMRQAEGVLIIQRAVERLAGNAMGMSKGVGRVLAGHGLGSEALGTSCLPGAMERAHREGADGAEGTIWTAGFCHPHLKKREGHHCVDVAIHILPIYRLFLRAGKDRSAFRA